MAENVLRSLHESLKTDNISAEKDWPQYVCQQEILKGHSIKFSDQVRDEMLWWKEKAVRVEERVSIKKKTEMEYLRQQVRSVEERIEKRNFQYMNTDMNHNYGNDVPSQPNELCGIRTDHSIDSSVGTQLSLDSVNFKEISRTSLEKSSPEQLSPFESKNNDNIKSVLHTASIEVPIHEKLSVEEESLHLINNVAPELEDHLKSLHSLQQQQTDLDTWYEDMQKQLELEQIHLKEKYEKLRLRNIREQERIIDTSQDVLKHSLNYSKHIQPEYSSLSQTPHKLYLSSTTEENSCNQKQKIKRTLPSPPVQVPDKKEVMWDISENKKDVYTINTSEHSPENNTGDLSTNLMTSDTERVDANVEGNSRDVVIHSPINVHKISDKDVGSIYSDSMSELEKLRNRRKSRPIKFFTTPVSDNKRTPIRCHTASENSSAVNSNIKTNLGGSFKTSNSSSTPHEDGPQKKLVYDFSPVYGNVSNNNNCTEHAHEITNDIMIVSTVNTERTQELLLAAVKGFLTRRLFLTNKVQDIVKTIKDTRKCLSDMDKENSKNKRINYADKQLCIRLQDELSTKHQKLHDIFFNMAPQHQMKMLSISRLQIEEKRSNIQNKLKAAKVLQVNKKLSTASQRSMKRRQENLFENQKRPVTAPEKISSVKKTNRKEARALKPIQSCSSPILSDKVSRPKTSGTIRNKYPKKTVNKKLNMNSVATPQSQRVMAANLKNRHSSAV